MERDIMFDTELLIDEIEKRGAIWDMESCDYSNRSIKRRNWEEIVEIFCQPGDSVDKKRAVGISLQKRWKGLRDSFVREMKKIKTGSGAPSKSKYFERLMFLEGSIRNKITDADINTTSAAGEEEEFTSDGEDPLCQEKKLNTADEEYLTVINKNVSSRIQPQASNEMESDGDKLFCLSLHKELIKIPEENRLQTKIELMKVLQAQQATYHTSAAPSAHLSPHLRRRNASTSRVATSCASRTEFKLNKSAFTEKRVQFVRKRMKRDATPQATRSLSVNDPLLQQDIIIKQDCDDDDDGDGDTF